MKNLLLVILVLSTTAAFTSTSHSAQHWDVVYGGSRSDYVHSIQQTTDGGYIVAGSTDSFGCRDNSLWVLKLDNAGNITWQNCYQGCYNELANSIQQTSDGGYIMVGRTWSSRRYDFCVLKLDSHGNVTWQKTYGGDDDDYAHSVQQTSDGGYIVAGETGSFGAGKSDVWILKLDSSGDISWQKTYKGGSTNGANSIQQTSDGGYIVAGYTQGSGNPHTSIWVLKLDSYGEVSWQKTYGGSGDAKAYSTQQTTDGGYIVAGYTEYLGAGVYDVWILKLDSNGDISWQKTYEGYGWDHAYSIQQTSDGGYIVAGDTWPDHKAMYIDYNIWVLKLNSLGNVTWQKTYGGDGWDKAYSIQQTSDGGYIVAGYTRSFGAGESDAWVLKLDRNGEIPGCNIMGTSFANVCNVSSGYVTNATVESTNASATEEDPIHEATSAKLAVICTAQIDPDEDEIPHDEDNCPYIYNPDQEDSDDDERGNICDNCPDDSNPDQENSDGDGFGDVCDNCPSVYNPFQKDRNGDGVGNACDNRPNKFGRLPVADGHYYYYYWWEGHSYGWDEGIRDGIKVYSYFWIISFQEAEEGDGIGLLEFDISGINRLFTRDQMGALLSLKVKYSDLSENRCLSLYNMQDENENGVIEGADIETSDYLGEVCGDLQPGDTITFDVTSAVEHDLFDPSQTRFSGFVIDGGWGDIEFYDHTDRINGPRLRISPLCPTEQIFGEHSEKTERLRNFRDEVLTETPAGQELIKLYYQWSPAIVKAMEDDEGFKAEVKEMIEGVLGLIDDQVR